eukprot:GHVL01013640.1.p1 GENE.GHVL01013640.1~~GHVL01013640.1.p1  ORF type:complete len:223 (+),score=56.61 GHVL01013640.1:79-747(+)
MENWLPVESNPDVLNKFLEALGGPPNAEFVDVFDLDEIGLNEIKNPVNAMLFQYQYSEKQKAHAAEEAKKPLVEKKEVFFMKQIPKNACGTVALLNAFGNLPLSHVKGGVLDKFFEEVKSLTAEERGKKMSENTEIKEAHNLAQSEGQSDRDDDTCVHFATVVEVDGHVYELDGRKEGPIDHGKRDKKSFLDDAVKVVKSFIDREPEEFRFTVMAISHDPKK